MKLELLSAANFLVHLVRLGRRNVGENQLERFRNALIEALRRRYRDHWFPEKPFKVRNNNIFLAIIWETVVYSSTFKFAS